VPGLTRLATSEQRLSLERPPQHFLNAALIALAVGEGEVGMPVALLDIGAGLFYTLVVALVAGRFGLLFLKLGKFDALARAWAKQFNHLTTYLR